jgi:hypothetical protein
MDPDEKFKIVKETIIELLIKKPKGALLSSLPIYLKY